MSDTYTKLFSSITESTVWGEPYSTRIVWVTMLAMADSKGNVYGSIPGLARRANVTLPEVEAALEAFMAPDRYSRTADNDGRRIAPIDGGWELLNHAKYRAIRNAEERREYKRQWWRDNRSGTADKLDKTRQDSTGLDTPRQPSTISTDSAPPSPTPAPDKARAEDQQHARRASEAESAVGTDRLDDDLLDASLPVITPPDAPADERSEAERAGEALTQGSAPEQGSAPATARPVRPEVLLGRALIAAGVVRVNTSRLEFAAAVGAGVLPDDLPPLVEEFPGKPAAYLLQVAITRRREAFSVPAASRSVAGASRTAAVEAENVAAGEVVKARIRAEALARGEPIE